MPCTTNSNSLTLTQLLYYMYNSCTTAHVLQLMYYIVHVPSLMYYRSCTIAHVLSLMYYRSCTIAHVLSLMYYRSCTIAHVLSLMYYRSCTIAHVLLLKCSFLISCCFFTHDTWLCFVQESGLLAHSGMLNYYRISIFNIGLCKARFIPWSWCV